MSEPIPLNVVQPTVLSEVAAQILSDVRDFGQPNDGTELIGYAVVALYSDGSTQSSSYRPGVEPHKIGNAMFEGWVRSGLEGQLANAIAIRAAHNVLRGID